MDHAFYYRAPGWHQAADELDHHPDAAARGRETGPSVAHTGSAEHAGSSEMIHLGYEVGTGKRVSIPLNHMVVLGQTQLSGKTTTLEALVARSGIRAIAFITKPGEKS